MYNPIVLKSRYTQTPALHYWNYAVQMMKYANATPACRTEQSKRLFKIVDDSLRLFAKLTGLRYLEVFNSFHNIEIMHIVEHEEEKPN